MFKHLNECLGRCEHCMEELSPSIYLSPYLHVYMSLCVSLSLSISLCVSHSLYPLSLSPSLPSLSLLISLSLPLSPSLSLSLSLYVSLSISLSISPSLPSSPSLYVYLTLKWKIIGCAGDWTAQPKSSPSSTSSSPRQLLSPIIASLDEPLNTV